MKKPFLYFLLVLLIVFSFVMGCFFIPLPTFQASNQPDGLAYEKVDSWACLPFKEDIADIVPEGELAIHDSLKQVDVFYIYPTIYIFGKYWNADPENGFLNFFIEQLPIKYHASVFNQVGRVYVPRYRQAILQSYFDSTGSGQQALDFAYEDLKRAFEYYLQHYNQGRPIILASHSQGTTHSRRLLKDYFDNPEMKEKLVCAYLVGNPLYRENYQILTPCDNPEATNCYVAWCSFKKGFSDTTVKDKYRGNVCVNPVSWKLDTLPAETDGTILRNFYARGNYHTTVQMENGGISVQTDHWLMKQFDDLHNFDFNLFWHDIRENASVRVNTYLADWKKVHP